MQIYVADQKEVQALIAFNKKLITNLENQRKELQKSINILWKASDPMNTNVDSITAFSCLNITKDQLRKVKKDIALLAKLQYSLKYSSGY